MNISVDIEADGQIPGPYSMVCFGAVVIEPELNRTFYGKTAPISDKFYCDKLAISGFTRQEHLLFPPAKDTMIQFNDWLLKLKAETKNDRIYFISDNNGFDSMFISWYLYNFVGDNPFGHSSMNLNSFYKGVKKDLRHRLQDFRKKNCKTPHNHNPVNDAKANAEAFLLMSEMYGVNIK